MGQNAGIQQQSLVQIKGFSGGTKRIATCLLTVHVAAVLRVVQRSVVFELLGGRQYMHTQPMSKAILQDPGHLLSHLLCRSLCEWPQSVGLQTCAFRASRISSAVTSFECSNSGPSVNTSRRVRAHGQNPGTPRLPERCT